MGVVFSELKFTEQKFGYNFLKESCKNNQIELVYDYPEEKMISTLNISEL